MPETPDPEDEVAAGSSGYNSKRFVSLVRFASLLIDQTFDANLTPDEMRFVAAFFKNGMDLIANDAAKKNES